MRKKKLVLIFNHFEQEHFGKDVFCVPYYLGKLLHCDVEIVYPYSNTNKGFPNEIKGVKLTPLKFKGNNNSHWIVKEWNFIKYIVTHSLSIDILMRFHITSQTALTCLIYKLINWGGKIYVKLDIDPLSISLEKVQYPIYSIKKRISRAIFNSGNKCVNVFSCETSQAYQKIIDSPNFSTEFKQNLLLIPNGFDEETLQQQKITELDFEKKGNIIISVGRLGTEPKNTEFLIKGLEDVNLKDWTVYLIGPIEDHLNKTIESFYARYPEKKSNVIFTGPIYDKKELWEYYNKANVFVLTSRHESYALVLNEAKRFRNYIVSTDVGASRDLIENNRYGTIFGQNNTTKFVDILQNIIDGYTDINVYKDYDPTILSWEHVLQQVKNKLE